MITLTILIAWVILIKWQVRNIHNHGEFIFHDRYKQGDVIIWNGYRATCIDVKTTHMVIRRHLTGLVVRVFT